MSGQAIILMKLAMGRYPSVDVTVPLSALTDCLEYFYNDGSAISYVAGSNIQIHSVNKSNAIYISDLDTAGDFIRILLVRGDPGRAYPGLVNPVSRDIKALSSDDPDYVPGASCHLVISKKEIASAKDAGRYRMAMQRTRGIGRALARDFVGQLLARYAAAHPDKFTAEKKRRRKTDRPETITYRPTVRFHPQENASLKKDLKEGKIGGFRLMRGTTKFKGEAQEPQVKSMNVSLQASIIPTRDFFKVRKIVDSVRQAVDNVAFEALNLDLIDDDGNHMDGLRPIKINQLDDADMRYCRTISMPDIGSVISECHAEFYPPVLDFSKKCLENDEHWK